MKALVLAGGTGTRLWPVSRKKNPKQIEPLVGKESLLKTTVKRIKPSFKSIDIILSVNREQLPRIKKDLGSMVSGKNYLIEPIKRDTAAAIGLAAALIAKTNPQEIIVTVNADHYIKDSAEYLRVLKSAGEAVKKYPDHLVLVGIKPSYPETGYGYIKLKKPFAKIGPDTFYQVDCFKEKPDLKTAKKYLANKNYLWNPAYFVFQAGTMMKLFQRHLPEQYKILTRIAAQPSLLKSEFKKIKPISIDYAIMEKSKKMLCLPAKFSWSDIGHFASLHKTLAKSPSANVVKGKYLGQDSSGNLVYNYTDKLVATLGVKNFVIVETNDVLLVCPKNRAQDVKKLVEELERKKMLKYL
ncbi:MAG: sugar phosphate nucleotidyltransferase [Candidatus Komeilibacteria bacterium]|nr:sugar phosphate nucleotidyltransferase [Candidatus Komeilibacteria bacterium]